MKFSDRLKAIGYVLNYFGLFKHLFVYLMACKRKNLTNPSIYDIDAIAEQMNELMSYANANDDIRKKMCFKKSDTYVCYTRDDVKMYQHVAEHMTTTIDDIINQARFLRSIICDGRIKACWKILKGYEN